MAGAALLAAGPAAKAALPGSPVVVYSPNTTQNIQGDEPLHASYVLGVSVNNVVGSLLATVSLNVQVLSAPAGVSNAVAASYVTFSLPTLNFTSGGQVIQTTVHVDVPVGATTGDFSYEITTSGWPVALGVTDNGTYINMHADPPASLAPPTITINTPVNGTSYTYVVGGPAVSVPVSIVGIATQSAPILTLTATLDGVDNNGVQIPTATIPLVLTDLGTPSATGAATLAISTPGTYTITATTTNSQGNATATTQFIVVQQIPPPPVIVFTQSPNATYTVLQGSALNIPFAIQTSSTGVNIAAQDVTLGGDDVSLTSNTANGSALIATGGGTLSISTAVVGTTTYTLAATGTDVLNQTASTQTTFQVTVVAPAITIAINPEVAGNSPYTMPTSGPLAIPFTFTGDITLGNMGATVDTITGVLGGAIPDTAVSITSSTGLGTAAHATGSGTLSITSPGTYTLSATDTNTLTGISATTSVTFVVQKANLPPPPVIVFTQSPNATYSVLQGAALSIPFAIQTSSTGVDIASQSVTLNGQPVTLSSNTANGTALVATGGGTLSIPTTSLGTTTYTLHAYGLDALGQPCDTVTTFTVTVTAPVITIAINPQVAGNSPYTLPTSGPLSIPFTFTGDITAGATVDTISGALGASPVTITSYTGLGTSSHATGSGTLTITSAGTYSLTATDTNNQSGISATTSVVFIVQSNNAAVTIDGTVFFDVNYNAVRDTNEFGLAGVTVNLLNSSGKVVATDVTDAAGGYSFTSPGPGSYTVSAAALTGYTFTTPSSVKITVGTSNVTVADIGMGLYTCDLQKCCAKGCSTTYWQYNIGKCCSGYYNGMQCSPGSLNNDWKCVASSGCNTYRGCSMQQDYNYLCSNSNDCTSQLAKKLTACEYNYACGAYINNNKTLTYCFINFAEYVLANCNNYTSTYINWVGSWCDAYNNSNGGRCNGPSPQGSDQSWMKSNCYSSGYNSGYGSSGYNNNGWNNGWNNTSYGNDGGSNYGDNSSQYGNYGSNSYGSGKSWN